ncbi:MAG: hypothetical protein Q9219_006042 [cf. Caloplaca sp. 3 TL-2023]
MPTQYDRIGPLYDHLRRTPGAKLVKHNVRRALTPYIRSARALDLACGTGNYTHSLSAWGASHIHGVDISPAMIAAAEKEADTPSLHPDNNNNNNNNKEAHRPRFEVGDCAVPRVFGDGGFDVVLGVWLLNYARGKEELKDMFRTAAVNLKPGGGGVFVAVTPPPTEEPRAHDERTAVVRPAELSGGVGLTVVGDVEDGGVKVHVGARFEEEGGIEFDYYHLRKGVYESAAREGGLVGDLVWRGLEIPERRGGEEDDEAGRREAEYWRSCGEHSHFGILMVWKD